MRINKVVILVVICSILCAYLLFRYLVLPHILYRALLVRTSPKKWSRNRRSNDVEIQIMHKEGNAWLNNNVECCNEVSITSDNLILKGKYFNFKGKTAVIIIPGRQETLDYSAYYADIYKQLRINVLLIDSRSHGESQGKETYAGNREYLDLKKWAELLKQEFHNEKIIIHGICVGAATALNLAFNSPLIDTLILDGIYTSYESMFYRHIKSFYLPDLGLTNLVLRIVNKKSGNNIHSFDPLKIIDKCKQDVLFIQSTQDQFIKLEEMKMLYDSCSSINKRIRLFQMGKHSRIRINNKENYDLEIASFIDKKDQ